MQQVAAHEAGAPPRTTAVMKFGGASIGDPERIKEVARKLVAAHERGSRVVGVVSAMGQTTDELLGLARQVSPAPAPRELDVLLSVGERIACALLAMAITDLGHEAVSLTGSQAGIITDDVYGHATIVEVRERRVREALDRGRIVLVAGFQGMSAGGRDITTLGVGGADTTAVALAAALGERSCEIYADDDGVYEADPAATPGAATLPSVSYARMIELCAARAQALSLPSVELARDRGVRIHVRSAFSDAPGTWVGADDTETME